MWWHVRVGFWVCGNVPIHLAYGVFRAMFCSFRKKKVSCNTYAFGVIFLPVFKMSCFGVFINAL
jgi:hypothetical protein